MRIFLSICMAGVASAQSFSLPLVGIARDEANRLRPVYGMAGNFITGKALGEEVIITMAFSGKAGLAKTETQLLLLDETGAVVKRYSAPPGTARFSFHEDRAPALCYFESTGELWRVGSDKLELVTATELEPGGQALLNADREDAPVLAIAGGIVRATDTGLLWQPNGAAPVEIPMHGSIRSLEQIGDGWVGVASADGAYALQIPSGKLYRLPAARTLQ